MLINLNDLHINFDLENDIPYFQVLDRNKLRLDFSGIEIKDINFIVNTVFKESSINCSFLSEYIKPVKFREKTNVGRYITITNWKEALHTESDVYIISTINDINLTEVILYLNYIKRGDIEPFIVFYDKESLIYISNTVVDIISDSNDVITILRRRFCN
ncbi:phage tail protein [Macrococcoides canis]|uniref:phage tail protein n=1 Tax=Macrococcoides canis TaxID=1855823 RepID=UPI00165DC5A9|nr:phage tail protein [Macrococcus canis]QNR08600.1 phage tail protein [Macrococcus canis]